MVTFQVSEVERATFRLPSTSIEARLAELGWARREAFRASATAVVDGPALHPLALAVHLAFADHRPLVITPDAVWMCLAQSLATHVELHAEALRPRLVRHAGQIALSVRRDDLVRGNPDNDWPGVVDDLSSLIGEHLGGRARAFVSDFSTTTPIERAASQITLMGAMRHYFKYTATTMCGIPEITLAGTPDDWASIRQRIDVFREFDLEWWTTALEPVLAQLEATASGAIDREFWRRLYKVEAMSGGDRMYGWLGTLFAYVGDPPRRNEFPTVDADGFDGTLLSDLPCGRTTVPFVWNYHEEAIRMELAGGMWGVTQDKHGVLGAVTGWVVADANRDASRVRLRRSFRQADSGEHMWLALTDHEIETLASLSNEACDQPTALSLNRAERLRSLDGIEHLQHLVELDIDDAPLLESVAPLAGIQSLKRLTLSNCPRLANLGAVLAALPQLEYLYLDNHALLRLHDVLPIARMPQLIHCSLHSSLPIPATLHGTYAVPAKLVVLRAKLEELAG